ncbi:restriction endonuclease subunit S [Nitrospira sp. CMX1]
MTDAIDLTTEQRNQLNDLLRRFLPGVVVWAYGSRVKWTARPNSDLDLVAFTTPEQRPQVADLKEALAESNLPFPVDLHVWDDVPERFREIIQKEYVVVQEAKEPEGKTRVSLEWQRHEVSKLLADGKLVIGDGYRAKNSELSQTGLPFARAGNINNGFQFTEADHFPSDALSRVGNKVSQPGDVVFTSKGTVGRFAFVREDTMRFVYSPQLCFWRSLDQSLIQSRFLYYWMHGSEFFAQFKGVAGQTDMAEYVSLTDQRRMHITLPQIAAQRAIAHILGTLDDKIELNRRMNETLEAMARALFKSWFVDFDPVRAKAQGRDTGLPKHLADLFPDSFEDSELGEIPRGWEVGTLADFSTLNSESWSKETRPVLINYVDLSNTKWGRIQSVTTCAYEDAPSRAQRVLRSRDTIVGTVRPGNGSYAFILVDGLTGSTGFAVLRPQSDLYAEFVYLAATSADNIQALAHFADGGAYPAVRPEVVSATQVIRPNEDILEVFSRYTGPMMLKIADSERESRTLATLRDTLLPKLISGEIRIAASEAMNA